MMLVREGRLALAAYDKTILGFAWADTGEPVERMVVRLPYAGGYRDAGLNPETQVFHWDDTGAVVPAIVFELYKRRLAERGRTRQILGTDEPRRDREALPTESTPGPKDIKQGSFR